MKAYKIFEYDWKCKDFQYEVGKTYKYNKELIICDQGFHACKNPINCFEYFLSFSDSSAIKTPSIFIDNNLYSLNLD